MSTHSPFPTYRPDDLEWFFEVAHDVRVALRAAVVAGQAEIHQQLLEYDKLDEYDFVSYQGHPGDPGHKIDGRARYAMSISINQSFAGQVHIAGEEDLGTLTPAHGELVFVPDALDGTRSARDVGADFSSTGLLYIYNVHTNRYVLLGLAVASAGFIVTWTRDKVVHIGSTSMPPDTDTILSDVAAPPDPTITAIVAAKLEDRLRWKSVLTDRELSVVYNTGGGPRTYGLLRLELASILSDRPQAPWDVPQVLPTIDAGGVVLDADGRQITREEALSWFEAYRPDAEHLKPIPPHIAASSEDAAQLALQKLQAVLRDQDQ
ncbi:hypothetical protein HQ535_11485 [bacterium]|nr:hypothetical protein [bacterium]